MKSQTQWLEEYGESHQNHINQKIHCICVPAIFLTIVMLLTNLSIANVSLILPVGLFLSFFYLRLSLRAFVIYLLLITAGIGLAKFFEPTLSIKLVIVTFVVAWTGQFIGHKIEGRRPSFFQDLKFLLVGPVWVFMGKHSE